MLHFHVIIVIYGDSFIQKVPILQFYGKHKNIIFNMLFICQWLFYVTF